MKIPLNTRDVEDWNCKDFLRHIQQSLQSKGVNYQPQYPTDIIAISAVLKVFKKQGKSNHLFIKHIDQILEDCDIHHIQNLNFIRTLVLGTCEQTSFTKKKLLRKQVEKRRIQNKPSHTPPTLSWFTVRWLQSLKPGI